MHITLHFCSGQKNINLLSKHFWTHSLKTTRICSCDSQSWPSTGIAWETKKYWCLSLPPPEIMIYVLGWIWIGIFKSFPSYSNVHPKLRTITLEVPKFKTIWTFKQFHQQLLGIRSMAKWWETRVTRVRKNK